MKRGRIAAIAIGAFTVIVVIVLVATFALSAVTPQTATATTTATSPPTITSTPDLCGEKNISDTVTRFDALSREFNDAFVLAQNTQAAQLSPVITDMQRIRRNAQDYNAPSCLDTLKQDQLGFMNAAIDASLALFSTFGGNASNSLTQDQMQQVVLAVNQRLNDARQYSSQYTLEMARLLGVTLTPSPTEALPVGTIGAIGTPGTPSAPVTPTP